ncbi:MAG: polymer-forming cytoskeletal protein [Pseudomonadota bacterium]
MFSKTKLNEPIDPNKPAGGAGSAAPSTPPGGVTGVSSSGPRPQPTPQPASNAGLRPGKPAPSVISPDLTIKGNLQTSGDMQIEGTIDGDIRSHLLTIGQSALVRGEVVADDVVVNGRIIGRIRAQKVRLSSTARVEGDILHKNIAIESGAQFEGSVQRSEDPLNDERGRKPNGAGAANMSLGGSSDPNGVGV